MAPHSSTLAWEIPWMEEPGGLQSMGSRRVGHDWATSLSLFTFMHWRRKWQPTPVFLPGESQGREPGRLLSMGSHRVGHNWRDLAAAAEHHRASLVAQMVKRLPAMRETWIHSLGKNPWRRKWQPTPVLLPGNSMDRGAWQATVYGVSKSRTRLSDFTSQNILSSRNSVRSLGYKRFRIYPQGI